MANICTFFCFVRYWNGAAPIIANCRGFFSNRLVSDMANNKANDEALICLCGTIYLGGGPSTFLLTHRYLRALGSTCGSNSGNFFVEAAFFCFVFTLGSFFKIFIPGVTLSFGLVTPKFVWGMSWPAGTFLDFFLGEEGNTILSDFCASTFSQPLTGLLLDDASAIPHDFISTVKYWQWPSQKVILLQLILIIKPCFCIHGLPKISECWPSLVTSIGASNFE